MSRLEALKIGLDAVENVPVGWIQTNLDGRDEARAVLKQWIAELEADGQAAKTETKALDKCQI